MRGEVPEGVHIVAHRAPVEPGPGSVQGAANAVLVYVLLDPGHQVVVKERVADHESAVADGIDGISDEFGLFHAHRHRLFHEDMLACL